MNTLSKFKGHKELDLDVEKVIEDLGIPYEVSGRDFVIRCVSGLHKDYHPSLRIDQQTGVFVCHPCGFKGNMVTLVSQVTGVARSVAYTKMESQSSEFFDEYTDFLKVKKKRPKQKPKSFSISLSPSFLKLQTHHKMFFDYLYDRNVSHDMIDYFDIRCCLIGRYNYRVIIPVFFGDKTVCFLARDILSEEQRFEREPGERYCKVLFPSGTFIGEYLFNYSNLDKDKELYLVEGIFDIFNLISQGYVNVTCTFSNHITPTQVGLLRRFRNITVIPDQDGKELKTLADNAKQHLSGFCNLRHVIIPDGQDPGDTKDIKKYIDKAQEILIDPKYSVVSKDYTIVK